MKLHEMDGFLKGKCLPGDMLVNETNAQYLVRKFAEADAKCAALAAENAALKKFIREKCFVVPDGASCFAEADECAEKRMPETPATDAWVNEQRAVGVDGAINVILTMMDRIAPAHHAISMLRAHAAQLRGSQV